MAVNRSALRQLRLARGHTLETLAARAGLAKATVQYIEAGTGQREPHAKTLRAIAKALRVPVSAITTHGDSQAAVGTVPPHPEDTADHGESDGAAA